MLTTVEFQNEIRCFQTGDRFELRPYTLLVGDQGCGKSTLLESIATYAGSRRTAATKKENIKVGTTKSCPVLIYDFEKDNPRTRSYITDNGLEIIARFQSHGEVNRGLLRGLERAEAGAVVMLLDEPDAGMSPRSAYWLSAFFHNLVDKGHQIVVAVHNPILIEEAGEVLSLEHRRWMSSVEFLAAHKETARETGG